MNIKFPILAFGLVLTVIAAPAQTWAAEAPPPIICRADPEAIVTLNVPSFGSATIWDAQFADKAGQIRFTGGIPLDNGDVLAAGQEQDVDFKPVNNVLAVMDTRARVVDDKRVKAMTGDQPGPIIALNGGNYVVASTIRTGAKANEKAVRLAKYDKDRKFKSDIILKDVIYDYEVAGLSLSKDGKSYIVIVHAVNRKDSSDEYGTLFRITTTGKIIWRRAYRPGASNQIYSVTPIDDHHYVAAGRVRNEDGRMAGWLMGLNDDGTITWQNTYPRGRIAILRAVTTKSGAPDGDHFLATGQVLPYGEEPAAVWVMELDSAATILWQRYIRAGAYNLDGRAIHAEEDGRILVMANATLKSNEGDGNNHIRFLTLSPRGEIMNDEAYMQGRQAEAAQFIPMKTGERLVIATINAAAEDPTQKQLTPAEIIAKSRTQGPMPKAADSGPAKENLRNQGWIFAATPLPPYNDPCVIKSEKAAQ